MELELACPASEGSRRGKKRDRGMGTGGPVTLTALANESSSPSVFRNHPKRLRSGAVAAGKRLPGACAAGSWQVD